MIWLHFGEYQEKLGNFLLYHLVTLLAAYCGYFDFQNAARLDVAKAGIGGVNTPPISLIRFVTNLYGFFESKTSNEMNQSMPSFMPSSNVVKVVVDVDDDALR